jgi:hypothetical protein
MWCRVDLLQTDVPSKRRFTQDLHGATSQKMTFLIIITLIIIVIVIIIIIIIIITIIILTPTYFSSYKENLHPFTTVDFLKDVEFYCYKILEKNKFSDSISGIVALMICF